MTDIIHEKLLEILDIEFINEFERLVKLRSPILRKPKYSIQYYLYHIFLVLTDLQKWKSLTLISSTHKKTHYKTIQDMHLKWSKLNIYEETYKNINQKYHKLTFKRSANVNLYIDSTNIYNKKGIEKIGYGQNPKKQESKISAICDKNKVIYSLTIVDPIKKTPIKNTLPNDSKTVNSSLNNLLSSEIKCKKINIIGDKGYATNIANKQQIKDKFNAEIIYPHRRNQKKKTPYHHKKLLKDRYAIEHVFSMLKKYDRICTRKDRLYCTYMGFLYLAAMINFQK